MCTDEGVQAAELTVLTVSQLFFHLVRRGSNSHPVGSFVITQMPVYIPVKLVPQSAGFVWTAAQSTKSYIYIRLKKKACSHMVEHAAEQNK